MADGGEDRGQHPWVFTDEGNRYVKEAVGGTPTFTGPARFRATRRSTTERQICGVLQLALNSRPADIAGQPTGHDHQQQLEGAAAEDFGVSQIQQLRNFHLSDGQLRVRYVGAPTARRRCLTVSQRSRITTRCSTKVDSDHAANSKVSFASCFAE